MYKKNLKYKVGDIAICKTFAGPEVPIRVLSKINEESSLESDRDKGVMISGFMGCLTSNKAKFELIDNGVSYERGEKPKECKSFVYNWQIIKIIKKTKR